MWIIKCTILSATENMNRPHCSSTLCIVSITAVSEFTDVLNSVLPIENTEDHEKSEKQKCVWKIFQIISWSYIMKEYVLYRAVGTTNFHIFSSRICSL